MWEQNTGTQSRLIARIVREVLTTDGPFECLADLTDVLKGRLVRLRIRCSPDDVSEAYRLIGSNRALLARKGK
jgi:hypothetical protein